MGSIGHPCVSDSAYGRRDALFLRDLGVESDPRMPDPKEPILARQALHAWWISFVHPATAGTVEYSAPVAKDMELTLELLRQYRPWTGPKEPRRR
jgi:23S rRNA pseudouridine1911/1915/1917 synthase